MKILADENIEAEIVSALRAAGHEVSDLKEISPGIADTDVLARAADTRSILLTKDKDFGELIYRDRLISNGVVLIRFGNIPVAETINFLLHAFREREVEMVDAFTVITLTGIRIRK